MAGNGPDTGQESFCDHRDRRREVVQTGAGIAEERAARFVYTAHDTMTMRQRRGF
jgi:hypothetical protein